MTCWRWLLIGCALGVTGCVSNVDTGGNTRSESPVGTAPPVAAADTRHVYILAINDFHGNLQPPAALREANPAAPGRAIGGVDVLAGYVRDFRARHSNTVVVSAGDLVGASPLVSALFHDEPTIEAMNRLGLDINAVGNHEFDDGRAELLRLAAGGCHPSGNDTCKGQQVGTPVPFEGARFAFLAANVRVLDAPQSTSSANSSSDKSSADNPSAAAALDATRVLTLFPATTIRTFGDIKVAFIGLTLRGTPAIVDQAGLAGLAFMPEAATINAWVPKLQAQGVQAIVVLLHEGGDVVGARNIETINGCAGGLQGSPVRAIAAQLDDAVDLVISGHTHQAYICQLPNAKGRLIPVTSAHDYGRVFTEIALALDASGNVQRVQAVNTAVLRPTEGAASVAVAAEGADAQGAHARGVAAVPELARLVASYGALAQPLANRVIGRISAPLPREPGSAGESPLGRLIADAQLHATSRARDATSRARDATSRARDATSSAGAQIAFMNPGGLRASLDFAGSAAGEGDGAVTYGEAFTVQPFANALVTMTLTGTQLHTLLEQQFAGCNRGLPAGRPNGQSTTRLLQVSAGFAYAWSPSRANCAHVEFASLRLHGRPIKPDGAYRVTVNSFLASGGDDFVVLQSGTERVTGVLDLAALEMWLSAQHSDDRVARITRLP